MRLRLTVVLGLLLLAGVTLRLAPDVRERAAGAAVYAIPGVIADWTSGEGAPEWALPSDPNERATSRRTYRRGPQTAWVAVSFFTRQDEPRRRAAVNFIHPLRHTVRIDGLTLAVALNGRAESRTHLQAALIQFGDRQRLVVIYWHQMGESAYGGEYAYRLALTRDILLARRADSALVRIGVPVPPGDSPAPALGLAAELAPSLYAAAAQFGSGGR